MQTARSTRRPERRPVKARQACRFCGAVGCLKSAQLDRLVGVKAPRGSGALGRHQRRSIVSGIFLKHNAESNGAKHPTRTPGYRADFDGET